MQFWPGTSVVVDEARAAVGFSDTTVALAPHDLYFHCPSGSQELFLCPFQAEELKHAVATRLGVKSCIKSPACLLQTHTALRSLWDTYEAQLTRWKMPKQKGLQKNTLIFWTRSMPLFTFGNLAQQGCHWNQNNASKPGNSLSTLFNNLVVLYIWQ